MNNESAKPIGGKTRYESPETSVFSLSIERNLLQYNSPGGIPGGMDQPGGEPGEN